jgi:hypothetical protein
VIPDHWVEAGGTLVNLCAGIIALIGSRSARRHSNLRYFLWIFAALNLLPGAAYFLFSGVLGLGDWNEVIRGAPHQITLRIIMTVFGAGLYVVVVHQLAVALQPFCPSRRDYSTVGRVPYYAAGLSVALREHWIRPVNALPRVDRTCFVRRVVWPYVGG